MKHTITFEDGGQDFLEWDIENGIVIDSRPFQAWAWNGTKVDMTKTRVGQRLPAIAESGAILQVRHPRQSRWLDE